MSQIATYIIPNVAGAAFRAAVNNVTDALRDLNSGATGPAETGPYMLWADTATGFLKIRNAGDSAWIVVGPLTQPNTRRGQLWGMTLSNGTDATNDIDFAAGECADSTNAVVMVGSALTKQLDATWAAGTNAGGRMSAAAIANTTYHCFAILKDSNGTVDYGFDTSATAPTMPTGYTYFRRIGSILRESAAIVAFLQDGDKFWRKTGSNDVNVTTPGTSAVSRTLAVPLGLQVEAFGNISLSPAGATAFHLLSDLASTDITPASPGEFSVAAPSAGLVGCTWQCRTNTSAQIRSRNSTANGDVVRVTTKGWIDTRGRLA